MKIMKQDEDTEYISSARQRYEMRHCESGALFEADSEAFFGRPTALQDVKNTTFEKTSFDISVCST